MSQSDEEYTKVQTFLPRNFRDVIFVIILIVFHKDTKLISEETHILMCVRVRKKFISNVNFIFKRKICKGKISGFIHK